MSGEHVLGEDVLRSNQALREWAAGLRQWSMCARGSSSAERVRTHQLMDRARTMRPGRWEAPTPNLTESAFVQEPVLPGLGDVRVSELFTILVDRHSFHVEAAVRALATAMLVAGYPADYDKVSAVDAFDILDWAIHQGP